MGKVQHRFTNVRHVSMKKTFIQKAHTLLKVVLQWCMLNRMNLSVQIVARILSMKIAILLVRDFTNVVLTVSNNLIDRQPYRFYNIQYLIIDILPRCNCR